MFAADDGHETWTLPHAAAEDKKGKRSNTEPRSRSTFTTILVGSTGQGGKAVFRALAKSFSSTWEPAFRSWDVGEAAFTSAVTESNTDTGVLIFF